VNISTQTLAAAIGDRVRQERQARRWTFDRLAEVSGLSRRLLIKIEQGDANPSVGSLLRISDALGIPLPALVEAPSAAPVRVTRSGDGAVLWSSESGGQGVLLTSIETPDVVELWDWTMNPGDRHESEPHSPRTRELLSVQEGAMTLRTGVESLVLEAGDAVTFPGDQPHSYANEGSVPARFALSVFEPRNAPAARPEDATAPRGTGAGS
jgi:transcriptional regulator with XRE-family HTH domain